jgi:alkylation response protein AidB-like acyl-CoA dehydrogenase
LKRRSQQLQVQHPARRANDADGLLRLAREITRDVVAGFADVVDQEARWPEEGMRALLGAGLGGLVVPHAYGGKGHGLLVLSQVCEILGRECASTAICFGMHCVGASVISANPTLDQRERYLAPICAGQHVTSLSLSEAGTGAHFYLPQTKLELKDDGFHVTGEKTFVTNGGKADSYVVSTVAADADAPMGRYSYVLIPGDANGIEWGPPWEGLGLRGNSSRTMQLRDVVVPSRDLIGNEGDQIWYVFNVICPFFLVAIAGTYLGVATSAVEEVHQHLSKRHHSHVGLTLAQAPILQHRLGELWSIVERTRRLIYYAAASFDASEPDALVAVMAAKAEVADCVVQVVNESMTMMGGIAYRPGSKLHRALRDARASHVMSPTTDILRIWIGRALLGQPLLAD